MRTLASLLLPLLLGACSAEPDADPTELRDAIQAPQDQARAVEATVEEAAAKRREAIEESEQD